MALKDPDRQKTKPILNGKEYLVTTTKRVGIIGPTSVHLIEEKVGLAGGTLESAAREIGAFLAEQSLGMVCVPVTGVPLWALEGYKQAHGMNSLALWPRFSEQPAGSTDTNRGNPNLADQVRDDLTWGDEPFELAKASDCLAVIGLSCGTMVEMAVTKWIKQKPVLVVTSLITQIPVEIACELDLKYCDDIAALKRCVLEILL